MWQRVPTVARRSIAALPQTRLATLVARKVTADKLRILGFHGVEDLPAFERLLRTTTQLYTPVNAEQVVGWLQRGDSLPRHPVWFTFDDGLSSTFDAGGVLEEFGISATAFVCPSTVEQPARLWFQTVFAAEQVGIRIPESKEHPSLTALKRLPNHERVAYVTQLERSLVNAGHDPGPALGIDRLRTWTSQGHSVGNHTSGHPCLDTCTEPEQHHEIVHAHEQLQEWGFEPTLFAYPNGNHTAYSEQILKELGYEVAVMFDHRLSSLPCCPHLVSRLRIDSDISDRRALSILSGSHSTAFHLGEGPAAIRRRLYDRRELLGVDRSVFPQNAGLRNDDVFESDRRIAAYDEIGGLTPTETLLIQRWIKPGAHVLDLGVGAGRTLPTLQGRAGRYVAIDYSQAMVDAASTRFPGADVRWGDAADLSEFEDGSFDAVVFSFNGLDYLAPYARRRQALSEIRRVLRTDGVFIMSSHNPRAFVRRSTHDDQSRGRRTMISAYMSLRAIVSRGLSQSSLRGYGYHTDHVQGLHTYFAAPSHLARELAGAGYSILEMLGGDSPVSPQIWSSPWTYAVAAPRPEGLRITRVEMPKDGTELAAAWDGLASHAALGPFQTRQWVTAWSKIHPDRPVSEVLVAEDSEHIVGILPIARLKRPIHRSVPVPLGYVGIAGSGWGAGDHLGPLTQSSAVASALLETMLRAAGRRTLLLESMDPIWAPIAQAVTGARSVALTSCPRNTRSEGHHFSDSWSAKARKNSRRRDRGFAEAGITARWTPSGPDFPDVLRQLRSLHEQRWGDRGEPGLFSADREGLITRWADLSDAPSGPWILTLDVDGLPVAALLGIRYGDCFSVYKTGWLPAYSRHGVGIGMGQEAMRWAEQNGLHVFDYLRGDGAHKFELGCQRRHDVTLLLAQGISGALLRLREDSEHPVRRLVSAVMSKLEKS